MKKLLSILLICLLVLCLGACSSNESNTSLSNQDTEEQASTQEETKQQEVIEETEQEEVVEEIQEDTKKEIDDDILKTYKYWVVFFDHDGNELQREALKWGTTPTYWSDIPYYSDAEHWYQFVGWKDRWGRDVKEFKPITGNTRFYAQYEIGGDVRHGGSGETPAVNPYHVQISSLTSVPGAYINSNLKGADNMEFIFDAKLPAADGGRCFGHYASQSDGFLFQSNAAGQLQYYNGSTGAFINNPGTLNQKATYDIKYSGSNSFVKVNGEEKSTFTTNVVSPNKDIYIFALNDGSPTSNDKKPLTMYYMKIYKDGALVRDYIPVRIIKEVDKTMNATDSTSNIPVGTLCFYDKVEKMYYPSNGPKIFSDNPDHLVINCLTSPTGTNAYIKTGLIASNNMKFEFKAKMNKVKATHPFGHFAGSWPNGLLYQTYENGYEFYFGNGAGTITQNVGFGTESIYEYQVNTNDIYVKINGETLYTNTNHTPVIPAGEIYLFGQSETDGSLHVYNDKPFTIYYFKIYQNGVLVRDFIPVYTTSVIDKSKHATNHSADIPIQTYCMYDKLHNEYYTNSGTVAFTEVPIS